MKTYSKKRSIISLILAALVIAGILYLAIFGAGWDRFGSLRSVSLGLDLRGGVSITYQAKEANPSAQDMADTLQKLQLRVADFSSEANVYTEGTNRITVDIPGRNDADEVLAELGKPGALIFCTDANDPEGTKALDGNDITAAQVGTDNNNEYIVLLTFSAEGQEKFAKVTGEIAGTDKPLYIMYDGEVISNPTAKEQITSPSCQIEGNFTYETASTLATFIRIGALPVELEELRSQVVGAQLGSNAIQTSLIAALIGLAIVCILMIILFRMPGFAASVALAFYTALIVVILSIFKQEITLTLPGIAGIILSIGMAVDANVIIFSRIKEEIGQGNGTATAINAGFHKALSAIIDGNVTTLIAAVVLFILGSGPVKNFAVTLAIGIVLSMFTALVVTRVLIKSFYGLGLKNKKWYGEKKLKKVHNFVSKRGIYLAISGALIAIGVAFMVINGTGGKYALNFSLDFVGGTSTDVVFNENRSIEELERDVLPKVREATGTNDVTLTPVVGSNEVIIKTPELSQESRSKLYEMLEKDFNVDTSAITYENISGTVSSEMARAAIISVIVASLAMLIYIWIRFRDIRFASSSVLCLVHDVFVVLAGYAVFRWTVGNTFIACMLTLVGYSINATIVVFDRIRENQSLLGHNTDLKEVVNRSITETLGRSVWTSLSTLIMVAVLYILGVTAIKDFALPLMVGIVVGCYSSVCLAGSLWYIFKTKIGSKKKAVQKTAK